MSRCGQGMRSRLRNPSFRYTANNPVANGRLWDFAAICEVVSDRRNIPEADTRAFAESARRTAGCCHDRTMALPPEATRRSVDGWEVGAPIKQRCRSVRTGTTLRKPESLWLARSSSSPRPRPSSRTCRQPRRHRSTKIIADAGAGRCQHQVPGAAAPSSSIFEGHSEIRVLVRYQWHLAGDQSMHEIGATPGSQCASLRQHHASDDAPR